MVMDYFRPGETVYTTRHKLAIVKLLLSSGADANQLSATRHPGNAIVGEGQVTPLHLAIKNKADSRVIQTLLEHGASATQIAYHTASPGQFYSTLSPISHLINAYPDLTEDQYRSASHLVNYGAGTGTESSMYTLSGNPLLVECLSQPRQSTWWTDMTKLLLSGGCANANDTSHRGQSAIVHYLTSHVGWEPSHPYERRFVLSHELRYEMSDTAEITCKNIRLLFQFGADINSTGVSDSFRETPLHVAAGLHENFHYIFDELVQYGADTKAVTADGRTILHTLVQGDRHANPTRLTHFIKKLRIPRNAVDADGNTFLHYLCTSNMCTSPRWYKEVVKNYTQKDYLIKNNANQTPVEMAKNNDDHMGMVVEGTIQSAFDELYGNRTSTASGFRSKNGVGREKHQTKGKGRQIN
ncbi:ankyrin repeat-containing domain protein [Xylariales sp. AK1849]|nr:ankyrin repeat-containing domain protein [Xylariales sp. AK1849]